MDKRGLRKQILTQLIKNDPSALVEEILRMQDLYNERFWLAKGDKGDKGEQGLLGLQGERGVEGEKGEKGDKGEPGRDGINGRNGRDGVDGRDGKNGENAVALDLSPLYYKIEQLKNYLESKQITPEEVIKIIKNLKGEDRLDARNIKNLPLSQPAKKIDFSDMRWHGGGLSTSTIYTQSGTISSLTSLTVLNTLNVVFTFIVNGEGLHFNTDYTASGTVATYTPALDASFLGKPYTIVYA